MMSTANAAPVFLFVLTLISGAVCVAGIVGGTPVGMDPGMMRSDCDRPDFIFTEIDRCFHWQGLPGFKLPWDPDFMSFLESFVTDFEQEMCEEQFVQRFKEAYHCFYNSCCHCCDQFRTDTAKTDDYDRKSYLQDIELYMTDPGLFGDALRDICKTEDEDWLCLDDTTSMALLLCGLREFQTMISQLKRRPMKNFKPALCELFSGYQQCTTDHLKGCPQRMVSAVSRIVGQLTPPACHGRGTTGMDQDESRPTKSTHIHDEH